MTEAGARSSAGAVLKAARERQGTHIAMLAASIKVSPRKLEALENDRYGELPDPAFTRALAKTLCRALKIDAEPVLALLPQSTDATRLEHVSQGLRTPFRDTGLRTEPASTLPASPLVWAGLLLLVLAAAIVFVPAQWWQRVTGSLGAEEAPAAGPGAATATSADTTPAAGKPGGAATTAAAPAPIAVDAAPAASAPIVETVHSAPPADAGAAQLAPNGASVSVSEASWIEAVDAGGRVLLSRTVLPGETITLDGTAPLRMRIGNARATRLSWRGATVDLNASARDNIARVDLK